MKIRSGFVSNSSSSSFVMVGIGRSAKKFAPLCNALRLNEWHEDNEIYELGFKDKDNGQYTHVESNIDLVVHDYSTISFIGVDVIPLLKAGFTFKDMKFDLISKAKKLGVDLSEKELALRSDYVSG